MLYIELHNMGITNKTLKSSARSVATLTDVNVISAAVLMVLFNAVTVISVVVFNAVTVISEVVLSAEVMVISDVVAFIVEVSSAFDFR